jgi:hypothetical protein
LAALYVSNTGAALARLVVAGRTTVFTPLARPALCAAECVRISQQKVKMLRRSIRDCLAVLAFVAYLAHALIPSGFMPGSAHGHAQLVVCTGHMHGYAGSTHQGGSGTKGDSPCPFALGGGATPLPAQFDLYLARVTPGLVAPFFEGSILPEIPPRHAAPRGPPSLA